jgi:flagellar biosynthesis/type III secretory pathway chaperone
MTLKEYIINEIKDFENQINLIKQEEKKIQDEINKLQSVWQANYGAKQVLEKNIQSKQKQLEMIEKEQNKEI